MVGTPSRWTLRIICQVEAFAGVIDRGDWDAFPRRVVRNTDRLLGYREAGVNGTFFTLGWVAERHPELVRRIVAEGHELASHGSDHYRVDRQSPEEFRDDIRRSNSGEYGGCRRGRGYAPSFRSEIKAAGRTRYLRKKRIPPTVIHPIVHDLYGVRRRRGVRSESRPGFIVDDGAPVWPQFPDCRRGSFRLLPYAVTRTALRKASNELRASCIFYLHPWEIDPGQPRQPRAPFRSRLRHYVNLGRTEDRLRRLLRDFSGPGWIASTCCDEPSTTADKIMADAGLQ